jgi:IS30 family transposase
MAYTHLTTEQRNSIEYLKRLAHPPTNTEIAKIFHKHRTTIQKELHRNTPKNGKYNSKVAKQNTRDRRIKAHQKCKKIENNF